MKSTTPPPPPPGPPSGPTGQPGVDFRGLVELVDGTTLSSGAAALVSAIAANQMVLNHGHGRKLELIQDLYLLYRDDLLRADLNEDELLLLLDTTTPPAGSDAGSDSAATGGAAAEYATPNADTWSRWLTGEALVQHGLELGLFDVDYVMEAEKTACRMVAAEVAVGLGLSPREASFMVRRSVTWTRSTPVVVAAMVRGDLDVDKANVIGAATRVLNDKHVDDLPHPAARFGTSENGHATAEATVQHDTDGRDDCEPADLANGEDEKNSPRDDQDGRSGTQGDGDDSDPGTAETWVAGGIQSEYERESATVSPADQVAAEVIALGWGLSRRQVGELADALVSREDPTAAERRHRREVGYRGLEVEPGIECTATLKAVGAPADQAVAAFNRVDAIARRVKAAGDDRALHQLRCDLTLALLAGTAQFELVDPSSVAADARAVGPARIRSGSVPAQRGGSDNPAPPASVGCDCAPSGGCQCECGTGYADPADLARLERFHQANGIPAAMADVSPPAAPAALADVFPMIPVVPGEVPGRAAGLPGTVLTVPLQTVLGWIADGFGTSDNASASDNAGISDNAAPSEDALKRTLRATSTNFGRGRTNGSVPAFRSTVSGPGWLERVGPLVESVARRVLTARLALAEQHGDGEFRIAVTDKQGRVVQYHSLHARTLRGLLREAVATDYGTCVFPTCNTPAIRCQADHARGYAIVRATRIGNMEPLCGADHTVKTKRGYRIERTNPHDPASPATWQLIMRSGHVYPLTTTGTGLGTTLRSIGSSGIAEALLSRARVPLTALSPTQLPATQLPPTGLTRNVPGGHGFTMAEIDRSLDAPEAPNRTDIRDVSRHRADSPIRPDTARPDTARPETLQAGTPACAPAGASDDPPPF